MSAARTSPRSVPAARRIRAALVLGLFAAANLAGVVHEGLTVHARCAEHGELIHVSPTADGARAVADPRAPTLAGSAAVHRAPGRAADEHDHCFIGCALGQRATASRDVAVAQAARPLIAAPVPAGRSSQAPSGHLLRTAPKTSPPA